MFLSITWEEKKTFLLTTLAETCAYLAVKKLSALFRGTPSNHNGYFYYLNCLLSFKTKKP